MSFRLTSEQRAIVDAPLAPLRVAAGAGTGKTTTIVLRLAGLLSTGIEPEEALGITFTNKAAGELADRLRLELPDLAAAGREVQVATYHGFAYLLLQEFGALVGVERDAKIIGPADQRLLIDDALATAAPRSLDLTNPRRVGDMAFTLAGGIGDNLLEVEDVRRSAENETGDVWEARRELLEIVESYRAAKRRLGVVDYSDLVGRAHRLVTDHPSVAERIRSRYRIVLLDEYQDTDPAQRELLRAIFGDGFPVTAVGDSDQTIYEWRGASRLNFDGFVRHFPNADGTPASTLPLTLNRRSDRVILDLANRIRTELHGDEPFDVLRPGPGAGAGEIETGWLGTVDDEAAWIAGRIADLHDDGTPWDEIAVLFRKNADIAPVRRALSAAGIPAEVASIGGLLDVPEVVDLLAWLRVLDDPSDRTSLTRILIGGGFRLGLADLARLAGWSAEESNAGTTLIDAAGAADRIDGCSPEARERLAAFHRRYRRLLVDAQHASVPDLCRSTLDAMDAWIEIDALDEYAARSARLNLYRFLDLAETWKPLTGPPDLGGFLRYLDLLDEESAPTELDTAAVDRGDAVSLLTIHRAKGLEWDVVVIPSVVEGTFPSAARSYANPVDKPEYLPYRFRLDADTLPDLSAGATQKERNAILRAYHEAEEWRTAYVAVTRARHRLVVTGSHRIAGRKSARVPSRLFALAADLAASSRDVPDPGPIEPPPWAPDAPAPDPLFGPDGWAGALRTAAGDPGWIDRYPDHVDAARQTAVQMRLDVAALPQPERRPPAVTKATSVTGLVTLARCPKQFEWMFVDRLPTRPSAAMKRGVEFHRRLELHNLGRVPITDFEAASYDAIDTAGEGSPAAPAIPAVDVFFASPYAERRARFAEVPIDLRFGDVRVRGRIDAVYEPEPGVWEIVDYKSGRVSDDPALDVQLQTYAIAAADGAVAAPPPERLTVTFAFFGGGVLIERSVRVDEAWLGEARDRVASLTALFAGDRYEPTPSEACRRCDFASFCEAGKAFLSRR